jgi:hypothetical protein
MAKRSSGLNTSLSRQYGTASIFSRGMPCPCSIQSPKSMHHRQPILTAAVMSARSLILRSSFFQRAALCSNLPNACATGML